MKKNTILAGFIFILTLVTTMAYAGPWGGRFYGVGPMVTNLTPEQQTRIITLQQKYLEETSPIQEQLWKKKSELKSLWVTPNPNADQVTQLQKEIITLMDQLHEKSTKLRLEILKVINP
uniref:Periplasmic heavy metal sensor n=1 Tax=candidate division WOR-3 bacterium TaxID=2052148 RepID=A0A7V3NV97_UNCW3